MLDIDRDRQRISLGLKQTQEDPWQRIVDTYNVGDELAGKVTKVVTFGAFVEILDGVEGLVHISELAPHHVESPREIVHPGDEIRVKILEIDSERRRLSLSAKRVEDQILPVSRPGQPADAEPARREAEQPDGEATAPSRRRRGAGAPRPPRSPSPPRPRAAGGRAEAARRPAEAVAEAEAPAAEPAPAEAPEAEAAPRLPRGRGARGGRRGGAEAAAAEAAPEDAPDARGRGQRRRRHPSDGGGSPSPS